MTMNTVGDLLTRANRLYPDGMAVWYQGRQQTYAAFAQDVRRYLAALQTAGLARGDRVAVLSRNHPGLLKALFACALGGYVFVPVNFRLTAPEISFVLQDSGARRLFVDAFFLETARTAVAALPTASAELLQLLDAPLQAEPSGQAVVVAPGDIFGIYYTSGTTGSPKGVVLSHGNMLAGVINHTLAYGLGPQDVCLHIMPLYHTMEASLALCQFFVGGGNVIEDHFDKDRFWAVVDQHQVTHVTAVFTMLTGILECAPERDGSRGASLRTISLGGQAVPVEVLKTAIARLGEDRFIQVYGLTEAAPLLTYLPRQALRLDAATEHRLASVGKDMALCETRVVDDAGQEVAVDVLGEVVARGANIMQGYWQRDAETEAVLRDGWLHTGDVGRRDADGNLYIVDRKKDLIISGGENISPREVEEVLFQHPQIRECSVFGVPDEHWGEAVGAAISADGTLTEAGVIAFCAQSLGKYKLPRRIWFLDDLPRDPVGKIQKRLLRRRLTTPELDKDPQ